MRDALSVGGLKPPRPKDYRVLVATDAARELITKSYETPLP